MAVGRAVPATVLVLAAAALSWLGLHAQRLRPARADHRWPRVRATGWVLLLILATWLSPVRHIGIRLSWPRAGSN
jgi:cytochrome c oxidase assembly factor CtaG